MNATIKESYRQGFIDGMTAFAWWKDGKNFVGTTGMLLKEAIEKVEGVYNFNPPKEA